MKIKRISNFGSFGHFVDGVDMDHITEEQWMAIGQLHMEGLVTILRDIKITKEQYLDWVPKWGPIKSNARAHFQKKYGAQFDAKKPETWSAAGLSEEDHKWMNARQYQLEPTEDGRFLTRVYGKRDEQGHMLGYFSTGDIEWHSNECSSLTFSPCVSLLGWDHMVGSATGFIQTVDLYDSFTSSFQSELDEMILVHRYEVGRVNENEHTDEEFAIHIKTAFCPVDDAETPLVCYSPGGHKGLHYSMNTRALIKGMTEEQSRRVFDEIDSKLFVKDWVYDHYYQQNNDLVFFDQSVTLHNRTGHHPDRKAFRQQFDPSCLLDQPYYPWKHSAEFNQRYVQETHELVDLLGGDVKAKFKLP